MKFGLTQSLLWDASLQKVSKILKIMWDHTTQPRIGLSSVETSGPLGVNYSSLCEWFVSLQKVVLEKNQIVNWKKYKLKKIIKYFYRNFYIMNKKIQNYS